MLNIETSYESNIGCLKLIGELDISTIDLFRTSVENVHDNIKQVVLDFSDLKFVDSTGVGGLVQVIKRIREKGLQISVRNISLDVFEVLDLLGIPELMGEETFIRKS
ncbi:MAG: STAS domain-containing protein [Carboxydocellales bacterium]